ncbi:MAG: hypothetical protein GC164_07675 [Phycisphaera sp.]|nr:hypothetical protein [Phycisphaera sp.]
MVEYTSNTDLAGVAGLIRSADELTLTTHAKPDADALGSVIAMGRALVQLGKSVRCVVMPPVPMGLSTLKGYDLVEVYGDPTRLNDHGLLVILDTGAYGQVSPIKRYVESRIHHTVIVDHHLSGDIPAEHRYIDGKAAACCEIVAGIVDHWCDGERARLFDDTVRDALFVGIAADTGWFRFSNTQPSTHQWAADLLKMGVDHSELYRQLEQTERPEKLSLLIRALDSLKLLCDGRVALMTLRASDFADTGALLEETERFVDVPQSVATVQTVILVTQPPPPPPPEGGSALSPGRRSEDKVPGAVRLSFRSKPGPDAINVAELAQQFGGGGHARAAGAKVDAPFEVVVRKVTMAVTKATHP